MRAVPAVLVVFSVLAPGLAAGQSTSTSPLQDGGRDRPRVSVQLAGGSALPSGGSVISAALGYAPASRLELVLNVERVQVPFELERFAGGFSTTRGGTMTFVSGELRLALRSMDRVSPVAIAGGGGGISRPTVNAEFPDRVTNDLCVLYFGGGLHIPLGRRFSLSGDARAMLTLEGDDGVMAVWPVRAGVAWRF